SKVAAQSSQLADSMPQMVEKAKMEMSQSAAGRKLVEKLSAPKAQQKARSLAKVFFKSGFGVLGDLYIVLFLSLFFTASPGVYQEGMVKLVPPAGKQKAKKIFEKMSETLKKWLKGKLFAMFVVFILTGIGLSVIGLPLWLTLAIIAGLLNFIPNFGPLIALIPAVLVALSQGPLTAGIVAGLYILIQITESNFITPM